MRLTKSARRGLSSRMSNEVSDGVLRRMLPGSAYHVCEHRLLHEDDTFWGCQIEYITLATSTAAMTEDAIGLGLCVL